MKRGLKYKRVHKRKWLSKNLWFLLFVLIVISLFLIYYIFFKFSNCYTKSCFYGSLVSCNKVTWIRESDDADWFYKILEKEGDYCKVEVKLLKLKEGKIDLERLEGEKMICGVLKNEINFPEEDISKCSGKLKENLQEIIIQRMHDYLLLNLGEIKDSFKRL